ncbi:uncharacterized protein LOC115893643 [Rhinopithecus roxellana]|uniref:uncharacterized protein LOC115893643 n=1 Tax=Rhinopithecus roxellana TaxID=61622 RepID=UPI0012374C4F|nr:uncharacterized protein LOC115893643 [Rhinopithecus roxellana]
MPPGSRTPCCSGCGSARCSLGAPSQRGWGRVRGSVPHGDTLLFNPTPALSWPVWHNPTPTSPSWPLPVWEPRLTGESLQRRKLRPRQTKERQAMERSGEKQGIGGPRMAPQLCQALPLFPTGQTLLEVEG